MTTISKRLAALGLTLPDATSPLANYVAYRRHGNIIIVSGQLCLGPDGKLADRHKGKLGGPVSAEHGVEAARFCALNILAQVQQAVGDLDRSDLTCLRLGGFINAEPTYSAVAAIMNGASDLVVDLMGDNGRHTRSTVGVAILPLDAAVEVDAIFGAA